MAGGGDPSDTVEIRRKRLDQLARNASWAALRRRLAAEISGAVAPFRLQRRRLRAEREAERTFEMSPALLGVAGFDGYLRRFNPAFEVFGYSPAELLSRPWIEFAHPDDRAEIAQATAALERGDDVVRLDNRVVCRDGSLRWVEWSTRVVPEEGLIYAAGRDVTESRQFAREQAALRRVATLVARQTSQEEVFRAIAEEIGRLLSVDAVEMVRFEDDGVAVGVAGWGPPPRTLADGRRVPLGGRNVTSLVFSTRRAARLDHYGDSSGPIAQRATATDVRSAVGTPIMVEGRLWGAMIAASRHDEPLPTQTEARIGQFTELMATAIANTLARREVTRLADEQAALRRVATLVAKHAPQGEVFATIAEEMGRLLAVDSVHMVRYEEDGVAAVVAGWGTLMQAVPIGTRVPLGGRNVTSVVFCTGHAARLDDYGDASGPIAQRVTTGGARSAVGTPIVVAGRLWGAMIAASTHDERLPADTELRIGQFTELMATAIANAEARAEVTRLADEQAALRRVATLVARETAPDAVFAAVAREVGEVLGVDATHLGRYDADGTVVSAAQWGSDAGVPIGARFPLEGDSVSARVLRTGRPARMDDYEHAPGGIAATLRQSGIRSSVGVPISVGGRTWGVMIATSKSAGAFPPETESRLKDFTDLVANAISNATARENVRVLADEQAALRRVATLVAKQTPHTEVFAHIAEEIGRLLAVDSIEMVRYEEGRVAAVVAGWGALAPAVPTGTRVPLGGRNVASLVFRTGRAARFDDYGDASGPIAERMRAGGVRAAVGTPILAEGRLWGAMIAVTTQDDALPPDTESRIGQFTELMATAIANAEARGEVARLADEQAALRRVATLVAHGAHPSAVFDAVTREVAEVVDASAVSLARYDDDVLTVVAQFGTVDVRIGERFPFGGTNVTSTVLRTGATACLDDVAAATGPMGDVARRAGVRSSVGAPVVVDGRTWGVLAAIWVDREPPPDDTEERMSRFAELLDTAIANADSRDQLTASRARLLTAADDARRQVVRDLHDGAQQRLVHAIIGLQLAHTAVREGDENAGALVAEALGHAKQANESLRELAHGILPSVLTQGGLRAAIGTVVARLDLPVDVDVPRDRFAADIEASAYFIAAEALTNVVKHAGARRARVRVVVEDAALRLEVRDDGIGGADAGGHGLVGLHDRVTALGGRLEIESPAGGGTLLAASLPLPAGKL